jgi:hypothetical protein
LVDQDEDREFEDEYFEEPYEGTAADFLKLTTLRHKRWMRALLESRRRLVEVADIIAVDAVLHFEAVCGHERETGLEIARAIKEKGHGGYDIWAGWEADHYVNEETAQTEPGRLPGLRRSASSISDASALLWSYVQTLQSIAETIEEREAQEQAQEKEECS